MTSSTARITRAVVAAAGIAATCVCAQADTLTFLSSVTEGVAGTVGLQQPHRLLMSPDGAHVYVANGLSLSSNPTTIGVFARDEVTGALSSLLEYELGVDFPRPATSGSWYPWISPDGRNVYVVSTGDFSGTSASIVVLARDTSSGLLSLVETVTPAPPGPIQAITFSPTGDYVFATADQVLSFSRDTATGSLALVDSYSTSNLFGQNLATSPDGAYLYVLSTGRKWLRVLSVGAAGELNIVQKIYLDLPSIHYLTTSLDGGHVFLSGYRLLTFAVSPTDGKLSWVQLQGPGFCDAPVPDLGEIPTPDGTRLLSADAVYGIGADGSRVPLEALQDQTVTSGFTSNPWAWVMSPDGSHAYILFGADLSIAAFAIGPSDGPVDQVCRLEGKSLVLRNVGPGGLLTSLKIKVKDEEIVPIPLEGAANDPRCGTSPSGTVKADLRAASPTTGKDTGAIPLPCQHWTTFGPPGKLTRGYLYKDKNQSDGPCKTVVIKGTKLVSVACDNKGAHPLDYQLTNGVSEEEIDVQLRVGQLSYCTRFPPFKGSDGSDGKTFKGKNTARPAASAEACAF